MGRGFGRAAHASFALRERCAARTSSGLRTTNFSLLLRSKPARACAEDNRRDKCSKTRTCGTPAEEYFFCQCRIAGPVMMLPSRVKRCRGHFRDDSADKRNGHIHRHLRYARPRDCFRMSQQKCKIPEVRRTILPM